MDFFDIFGDLGRMTPRRLRRPLALIGIVVGIAVGAFLGWRSGGIIGGIGGVFFGALAGWTLSIYALGVVILLVCLIIGGGLAYLGGWI